MKKLWFSIYDEQKYKGDEKKFFDPNNFEWAQFVLKNQKTIIDEFKSALEQKELFDPYFNHLFSTTDGGWKTVGLKFWTINNYKNQKYFPKITKIINQVPGLLSASFSKLEANSEIIAHNGDTNGIYRCHLGIKVPAQLPECGFEVEDEKKSWKNGELLIFCDALNHSAWNRTEDYRTIMIFDIIREDYSTKKNKVVTTVLSSMFLQKIGLLLKIGLENDFKRKKLKPIVFILRPFARLAVWFTNFFKVY